MGETRKLAAILIADVAPANPAPGGPARGTRLAAFSRLRLRGRSRRAVGLNTDRRRERP